MEDTIATRRETHASPRAELLTRHLYTDSVPPAGSTRDPVSYRSWYFGRGKASSQIYAGLGASF